MSTIHIYKQATNLSMDCTGTTNINSHDGISNGLMLNNTLVQATAQEINNMCDVSGYLVNVTASTYTLSQVVNAGKLITANRAAGIAFTLPAATGSGARYKIIIGTTITSNTTTIATASGSDKICGFQTIVKSGTTTPNVYPITATSVTLTFDGSTKGGTKGDMIELIDFAANLWYANEILQGSGTITSNFS